MFYTARKRNRLMAYDYSSPGAYFITICTLNKQCFLSRISVGATTGRPPKVHLTDCGNAVEQAIITIPKKYPAVVVDSYCIMPNHVHLLIRICSTADGRPMVAPTVSTIIQQMKGAAVKAAGKSFWQKSFHDHIIRDENDYQKIWEYIEANPFKWSDDCFYVPE